MDYKIEEKRIYLESEDGKVLAEIEFEQKEKILKNHFIVFFENSNIIIL